MVFDRRFVDFSFFVVATTSNGRMFVVERIAKYIGTRMHCAMIGM
jgi:hypothetical protein